MNIDRRHVAIACVALGLASISTAGFVIFSAGGSNVPASIQPTVDTFRTALGNPNNGNATGPLPSGRREINWDGGGAVTSSPAPTPFTGFQNTRGALFTTPGTGFLQTPLDDLALTSINATYSTTFGFFSPLRIFTALDSNVLDIHFFVPGTLTPATVGGFGAVFTDVDLAGSTSLSFFDIDDNLLLLTSVATGSVADGSLSFLGAIADAGERIFRVRVTSGNTPLGQNDNPAGGIDVVAMDDFLYAEPAAVARVSEPSTLLLSVLVLAWLGWATKRNRLTQRRLAASRRADSARPS